MTDDLMYSKLAFLDNEAFLSFFVLALHVVVIFFEVKKASLSHLTLGHNNLMKHTLTEAY